MPLLPERVDLLACPVVRAGLRFVAAPLMCILVIGGCATAPTDQNPFVSQRIGGGELGKEVEAVKKLVPIGTNADAAKMILGSSTRLLHFYGYTIEEVNGKGDQETGIEDYDLWCLEYETPHGSVALWLELPEQADGSAIGEATVYRISPMKYTVLWKRE